jgi:hypothetical protein
MGMNLESLAAAYLRRGTDDKTHARAFDTVADLLRDDPEQAWQFTVCAIARSKNGDDLAYVAAGVLEDLLKEHGLQFIDRIGNEARVNEQMLTALSGCWINDSDVVFPRWFAIMEKYGFATGRRKRL